MIESRSEAVVFDAVGGELKVVSPSRSNFQFRVGLSLLQSNLGYLLNTRVWAGGRAHQASKVRISIVITFTFVANLAQSLL